MYRKMTVYTKSISRYKKERSRRRRVLEMRQKGWDLAYMANQIGCSVKTVQRDLFKLRRYVEQLYFGEKMENDEKFSLIVGMLSFDQRMRLLDLCFEKNPKRFFQELGRMIPNYSELMATPLATLHAQLNVKNDKT